MKQLRTEARLLAAGRRVMAQGGAQKVSLRDIAAQAGVTPGAIYRHFPNKDELLVALFEQVVGELLEGARATVRAR